MSDTETKRKPTIKERLLGYAEVIDAFRVVPRAFLTIYGILVYELYTWYTNIETVVVNTCDAAMVQLLMDNGQSLEIAREIACVVTEVIGGPTTAQTTFVTTVVGLATPIFAFYANTGRGWGGAKTKNASE